MTISKTTQKKVVISFTVTLISAGVLLGAWALLVRFNIGCFGSNEVLGNKLSDFVFEVNDGILEEKAMKALNNLKKAIELKKKGEPVENEELTEDALKIEHVVLTNTEGTSIAHAFAAWLNNNGEKIAEIIKVELNDIKDIKAKKLFKIIKEMAAHINIQKKEGNVSVKEYSDAINEEIVPEEKKKISELIGKRDEMVKKEWFYFKNSIKELMNIGSERPILKAFDNFLESKSFDAIFKTVEVIKNNTQNPDERIPVNPLAEPTMIVQQPEVVNTSDQTAIPIQPTSPTGPQTSGSEQGGGDQTV